MPSQEILIASLVNPESPVKLSRCHGLTFGWDLGSPHITYPFSIHDEASEFNPQYSIISISSAHSTISIQSARCSGVVCTPQTACPSCQDAEGYFKTVKRMAKKEPSKCPLAVLSHHQLREKLEKLEQHLKKEVLTVRFKEFLDNCN